MKLGNAVHVVRGVTNFDETLPFYSKIGYKKLEEGISSSNTKFALFTDGILNLLVTEDNMTYTGLIYFEKEQKSKVALLESKGIEFFWKSEQDGMPFQGMFEVIPHIFGINLVEMEYKEENKPKGVSHFAYGKFGEFSIPVSNFDKMEVQLHQLGFETSHKSKEPYPWGILSDGLIVIGVHQVNDFDNPTLTYFDLDMKAKKEKMKEAGIEFVTNSKVLSPDGQEFLFFQGEV